MNDSEAQAGHEEASTALSAVTDGIGDLVTGIPAPLRKNALKAFARLCTAAVEYPVALLENAAAERRAESAARVRLVNASAAQIAAQMQTSPEYVQAAASKFAAKIVRERVNLDRVATFAGENLQESSSDAASSPTEEGSPAIIEDDWLNAFEKEAAQFSSERMQRIFGRILAGEIRRPASYSMRTVKLMAELDNSAAELFALLASLTVSMRVNEKVYDARVPSLGGLPSANCLKQFGLNFVSLNTLHEYGLLIPDYNTRVVYPCVISQNGASNIPFTFQGQRWLLTSKSSRPEPSHEYRFDGVALSVAGMELLPIVDVRPHHEYATALQNFFDADGLVMTPI